MANTNNTRIHYIFVDFENVQPTSIKFPKDCPFKIFVFIGANQTKLPIELAVSMQKLGHNGTYVIINGNGKNALDFHITFYLGKLFEKDPNGHFHIISKDTGFDILIQHLKEKKALINRCNDINEVCGKKIEASTCDSLSTDEKIKLIVQHLLKRGNSKPRKVETLSNTINSLCTGNLNKNQLNNLITVLAKRGLIMIAETKVTYMLKRQ